MKKVVTFALAIAFCTSVYADEVKIFSCGLGSPGIQEPPLMGLGISPNGKYICGALEQGVGIFVADNETGDVNWIVLDNEDGGELRHVDNTGLAIGIADEGILFSYNDIAETTIPAPEGYRYFIGEDLTDDGSMYVGSLTQKSFEAKAVYTKGGEEWTFLPTLTKEQLGDLDPNLDSSSAKFVSGDGKVIFGHLGSFGIPIVWIMNESGEYEADFFPAKYVKGTEADIANDDKPLYALSGMYINMSHNGKYLCMVGLIKDDETGDFFNIPVIYNTENKEITLYKEHQKIDDMEVGLYPCAICDDGTFIGTIGQPYFYSRGTFIMRAGETQAESYSEAFPNYKAKLGDGEALGFNIPSSMSADGRYLLGYTYYCEDYTDSHADAYYVTYVIDTQANSSGVEDSTVFENQVNPESYYSIDGKRLGEMSKGINIVRMTDGTVRKVIKK